MNEIVYKCRYLEVTEEALCGPEQECVRIIHNLHCSVLQAGLDTVLSLIEIHHSQDIVKGRRSPSFITSSKLVYIFVTLSNKIFVHASSILLV